MYTVDAKGARIGVSKSIPREDSAILQKIYRIVVFAAAVLVVVFSFAPARAHQAPTGWAYPYQCCHDRDCRPIHGAEISEGPDGYVIKGTGEVVGYTDHRIRNSPDGEYHWCSINGKNQTSTICLFVPPRSF